MRIFVSLEYNLPVEGFKEAAEQYQRFREALFKLTDSDALPGRCLYASLDSPPSRARRDEPRPRSQL